MEAEVTRSKLPVPPHTAVILFRDSSRGKDTYTQPLLEDHDAVESLAVLQHQDLLTTQTIDAIVELHTSDTPFAGLVFTSQNAVEALGRALEKWTASIDSAKKERWDGFISLPTFVVGGATGAACRSILHLDVRGEVSGGASAMLPMITEFCTQYKTQYGDKPRLVFFCGDQRRDTLPDGLHNAAELLEVVSYATVGRDPLDTRHDLIQALARIRATCLAKDRTHILPLPAASRDILIWMVLFSPSGVRVVAPLLADLESEHALYPTYAADHARGDLSVTNVSSVMYGLAAIGATTRDEIVAQLRPGFVILAKEPNVQGIRKSICEAQVG
ncbi:uroporphyrinogen-III synthase [Coemansia aciculifera]|uniref:Uroporphyrinogen-III synthase n=1 Tax=Coemansia aciculifera TaxID=417176 RepID=A0A9W8M995_9FUNG|nr:uroporphyrinogen-III synthase [Coemansia aciculifera]KAJ2877139.1 uroporphyrinogen-III synthase [Coemansia aciculifera]